MTDRTNRLSGKPEPSLPIGRSAGFKCDHCGSECICDCPWCGAPNCCPRCCSALHDEIEEMDRENIHPGDYGYYQTERNRNGE